MTNLIAGDRIYNHGDMARTGAVALHCGNQYSDCPLCSFTCKVVELERNHGWCDCCAERMAQEQDMRDEYADWDF